MASLTIAVTCLKHIFQAFWAYLTPIVYYEVRLAKTCHMSLKYFTVLTLSSRVASFSTRKDKVWIETKHSLKRNHLGKIPLRQETLSLARGQNMFSKGIGPGGTATSSTMIMVLGCCWKADTVHMWHTPSSIACQVNKHHNLNLNYYRQVLMMV